MRKKMIQYETITHRDNVIEPSKNLYLSIKNHWRSLYFKNSNAIVLELACGKGEYTLGMGKLFPTKNFIGIDIKGDRLYKGSTLSLADNLTNVAFLRAQILTIEQFFGENEVDDIWLVFPDPYPKQRNAKNRLTHTRFLHSYKKILRADGTVRLKTDNSILFDYTLNELKQRKDIDIICATDDLYNSNLYAECLGITTHYEKLFTAQKERIKYLQFKFNCCMLEKT